MPLAPQQYQPQVGYQANPQLQALQSVIQAIRSQAGSGAQQPWGFHEPTINAGAGLGQGLSATGQAMADPRNAWMGLGGIAGMARFRRVPDFGQDAGGYQASINSIRQALGVPKPNRYLNEVPGGAEQGLRHDYVGGIRGLNEMSDVVNKGPMGDNAFGYHAAQDMYSRLAPSDQEAFQRVMQGRQALEQEMLRNSMPTAQGGGIPADAKLRRLGFGR